MPKFNDLQLTGEKWKKLEDIWTDSLWLINSRDKSWKHSNFYHGNFVPQIPNQLIKRFTKKWDIVIDPFLGSGTTAIECEKLSRGIIWIDIQKSLVDGVSELITGKIKKKFIVWDSSEEETYSELPHKEFAQLLLLHPPYYDIIKFSNSKKDLSNSETMEDFLAGFTQVIRNCLKYIKKGWYVWLVIGDKYENSKWIPLWFYCMEACNQLWLSLKSIIVKNMEWNRAKLWSSWGIWRYRALSSDYYIFKHEYIFIFKKLS